MLICFNGIDGSGKSLQAHRLLEQLRAAGYPAVYVWSGGRAPLTRPLAQLSKSILRRRRSTGAARAEAAASSSQDSPYRSYLSFTQGIFKRRLVRTIWLHVSLLEHMGEIWTRIVPHLLRGRIVVCDRYLYDRLVNIAVLCNTGPDELRRQLRVARLYWVPRPRKWFFIDTPADVAFSRKDDVPDILYLERRIPLYETIADAFKLERLDGKADPGELAAHIWQSVQTALPAAPVAALDQSNSSELRQR
jgi:thymidylate kinase